jgi:hypothetical protein
MSAVRGLQSPKARSEVLDKVEGDYQRPIWTDGTYSGTSPTSPPLCVGERSQGTKPKSGSVARRAPELCSGLLLLC